MSETQPAPRSRTAFVVHDLSGRTKGASPWTLRRKIALQLWQYAWPLLCAWTPKPFSAWRAFVLKLFGAKITGRVFIHQNARVQQPWNLTMHPRSCLGDGANAYTLGPIIIEEGATVGQEAYLCTGTHDFTDHALPLMTAPVVVKANAFIGVRAIIMPGVTIGEEAVVGAGSIVTKDVPPFSIAAGNPARVLRTVDPRRNAERA